MTSLTLQGLAKTYPGTGMAALHALDLHIESGSLTALLGPSGSGKTTTMRLIAGLLTPDAGDIRLGDRSIRHLPPERRGVTMVFQRPLLFPHLTVAGNVGFGLRMRGVGPDRVASEVSAMLDRVQLSGLAARRPAALSGGQAQRVALARALILRPEVLLLDEPLSSLDPALRDEMRQLIRDVQRDTGITTLVVTHDQAEAVALSDRIALLLDGRLAQHDRPEGFFRRPATLAVARFFGGVNVFPGVVRNGTFDCALGRLDLPRPASDGPGLLTIRPEAITLGSGALSATVAGITFLGTQSRVDLRMAGQMVQALTDPATASRLAPETETPVSFPTEALWVLPP